MAASADGIDSITVNLVHGQKKHNVTVTLPNNEPGGVIMNRHLADKIAEVTEIPVARQRLIFRGKTLKEPLNSVKQEGLTPGCKIMLLAGPKTEVLEDPQEIKLTAIEKDVEQFSTQLSKAIYKIDDSLRGSHDKAALHKHLYSQLESRLCGLMEQLTKALEKLDSLQLPEGSAKRNRRKELVDRIHSLLKQADVVSDGVTEKLVRIEKQEFLYL